MTTDQTCPLCNGKKLINDSPHALWIQVRDRLSEPPTENCPYCFGQGVIKT
jgi:hypothetical protein